MSANQQYATTESYHKVTLYTDMVTPTPANLCVGNNNADVLTFGLNSADLVAGSGFLLTGLDANNMYFSSGDLQTYGNLGGSGDWCHVLPKGVKCAPSSTSRTRAISPSDRGNSSGSSTLLIYAPCCIRRVLTIPARLRFT